MGPPNEAGRAAIFRHYMEPLVIDPALDPKRIAVDFASLTPGLTGADIAHVCRQAVLLCVKEASRMEPLPKNPAIAERHLRRALHALSLPDSTRRQPSFSNESDTSGSGSPPETTRYLMRG